MPFLSHRAYPLHISHHHIINRYEIGHRQCHFRAVEHIPCTYHVTISLMHRYEIGGLLCLYTSGEHNSGRCSSLSRGDEQVGRSKRAGEKRPQRIVRCCHEQVIVSGGDKASVVVAYRAPNMSVFMPVQGFLIKKLGAEARPSF